MNSFEFRNRKILAIPHKQPASGYMLLFRFTSNWHSWHVKILYIRFLCISRFFWEEIALWWWHGMSAFEQWREVKWRKTSLKCFINAFKLQGRLTDWLMFASFPVFQMHSSLWLKSFVFRLNLIVLNGRNALSCIFSPKVDIKGLILVNAGSFLRYICTSSYSRS